MFLESIFNVVSLNCSLLLTGKIYQQFFIDKAVVVKDNDFNEILGKQGEYTSCVYFTVKGIASDKVQGDSIMKKGTDGVGDIEVFKTVEEVQERIGYLAAFDNTLFYSGSYALDGTMVIRTSYLLDG